MPKISRFLGIVITINYNDHDPPHFHARYGRAKIKVEIVDGVVTEIEPCLRMVELTPGGTGARLAACTSTSTT